MNDWSIESEWIMYDQNIMSDCLHTLGLLITCILPPQFHISGPKKMWFCLCVLKVPVKSAKKTYTSRTEIDESCSLFMVKSGRVGWLKIDHTIESEWPIIRQPVVFIACHTDNVHMFPLKVCQQSCCTKTFTGLQSQGTFCTGPLRSDTGGWPDSGVLGLYWV